ncbi:hypothetical protein L1887_57853 [Cichorium endivia]|nr:hypothetical protein L1887_57853 [Cichorium endivia]
MWTILGKPVFTTVIGARAARNVLLLRPLLPPPTVVARNFPVIARSGPSVTVLLDDSASDSSVEYIVGAVDVNGHRDPDDDDVTRQNGVQAQVCEREQALREETELRLTLEKGLPHRRRLKQPGRTKTLKPANALRTRRETTPYAGAVGSEDISPNRACSTAAWFSAKKPVAIQVSTARRKVRTALPCKAFRTEQGSALAYGWPSLVHVEH